MEAALDAVRDPRNYRYTPAAGLPELREAIAAKTLRDSGLAVSPSQVVVTNGGKQAVYQAFATLLDPGDEVLVPTPYWTTYPEVIKLAGGTQVDVFADADQDYLVTVDQLEAARHRPHQGAAVRLALATPPARCTRRLRSRRSGDGRMLTASGSSPTRSTRTSPTTG